MNKEDRVGESSKRKEVEKIQQEEVASIKRRNDNEEIMNKEKEYKDEEEEFLKDEENVGMEFVNKEEH